MKIIDVILEVVLIIISLITLTFSILSGYKHAKAKAAKDEAAAAWYGAIERMCTKAFWASYIAFVVVEHMGLMTTGFIKILVALEGFKNG